ncbi:mechanosensitive ion channel [Nesterenkonia sp. F]|uniref:mechanosensitive ion channel n=1 Tax=Nesterenkonia sp. F TaxID=795955 RepID=UPI000255CFE5|nr:mechanosensitive ion channel [Nesterenkonia sp. F]
MDLGNYDWLGLVEKIIMAVVILLVTWIIASVVKWAISKLVSRVGFLQRGGGADGQSLGSAIGQIASLVIWLFGLIAVLQLFALERVLQPVQDLLAAGLSFLPNIIGAGFVFFIGFVIAKIVKQLIEATLGRVNFAGLVGRAKAAADKTAESAGVDDSSAGAVPSAADAEANRRITGVIGNVVFAVIVIVVGISALQILGIEAVSEPATQMLTLILDFIPLFIAAALILAVGVVIAKFVGDLLGSVLSSIGTDRAAANLGIEPGWTSVSSILSRIAQVGIVLFFGIMAARTLNFPEITAILNEVLELGGRVIFGAVIIGAGFFIANLLARPVGEGTPSTIMRYGTLALFVAMGLQYMGIADSIINLAFGAVVVGGALAAALAFGLGGRDAAARTLNKVESGSRADSAS